MHHLSNNAAITQTFLSSHGLELESSSTGADEFLGCPWQRDAVVVASAITAVVTSGGHVTVDAIRSWCDGNGEWGMNDR